MTIVQLFAELHYQRGTVLAGQMMCSMCWNLQCQFSMDWSWAVQFCGFPLRLWYSPNWTLEIVRSFIMSQTTISAQKQNGISKQYIWWKNLIKGRSQPTYFLLLLYQQQPVLLVTVCLRPHISKGGKNCMSFLEKILLLCRNVLLSRLVCSVMIWQFSGRLWG